MTTDSLKIVAIILLIVINIYLVTAELACVDGNCEVGCCVDKDSFQHNKYPKEMCLEKGGSFNRGFCVDMPSCKA